MKERWVAARYARLQTNLKSFQVQQTKLKLVNLCLSELLQTLEAFD